MTQDPMTEIAKHTVQVPEQRPLAVGGGVVVDVISRQEVDQLRADLSRSRQLVTEWTNKYAAAATERDALKHHLDSAYEAAGLSPFSSEPLAARIATMRDTFEALPHAIMNIDAGRDTDECRSMSYRQGCRDVRHAAADLVCAALAALDAARGPTKEGT